MAHGPIGGDPQLRVHESAHNVFVVCSAAAAVASAAAAAAPLAAPIRRPIYAEPDAPPGRLTCGRNESGGHDTFNGSDNDIGKVRACICTLMCAAIHPGRL